VIWRISLACSFADNGFLSSDFGFQHDQWITPLIQQQKIKKSVPGGFKILAKRIDLSLGDLRMQFKLDIAGPSSSSKKRQPASTSSLLILILALASLLIGVILAGNPAQYIKHTAKSPSTQAFGAVSPHPPLSLPHFLSAARPPSLRVAPLRLRICVFS